MGESCRQRHGSGMRGSLIPFPRVREKGTGGRFWVAVGDVDEGQHCCSTRSVSKPVDVHTWRPWARADCIRSLSRNTLANDGPELSRILERTTLFTCPLRSLLFNNHQILKRLCMLLDKQSSELCSKLQAVLLRDYKTLSYSRQANSAAIWKMHNA